MTTGRLMRELRRSLDRSAPEPPARDRGDTARRRADEAARSSARDGHGGHARSRAGDPSVEGSVAAHPRPPVKDPALLEKLKESTPAKVGVGRAGLRYRTETLLQFLADFAVAKAAVESQVPEGWAEQQGWLPLRTEAADPEQFLTRPDLGRRLPAASLEEIRARCEQGPDVQIVVGDGLSAAAVMQNAPEMVRVLVEELRGRGLRPGTTVFVRHCRAKILDVVGQATGARAGIILLGERPGLGTGDGMSAYLVWAPDPQRTDAEKQAISNVHGRGLLPADAGRHAARVLEAILRQQTSGVRLDLAGIEIPRTARRRANQAHPDAASGCGQSHGQQCEGRREGGPGSACGRGHDRPCEARRD